MTGTTKLICTVGPSSLLCLPEMAEAGMDVARLNFSHGSASAQASLVSGVRRAAEVTGLPIALLADLSGPKIRLGEFLGGRIELEAGSRFSLGVASTNGGGLARHGDASWTWTNYPRLAYELLVGDPVLLADGSVHLRVVHSLGETVITEVVTGGEVRSRAGVNVPCERLSWSCLTSKDRADLPRAIGFGAEFIAQSFFRRGEDVEKLRRLIHPHPLGLIAKIETLSAIEQVDQILRLADGIMVARGDLGAEIPYEEIPAVQKHLIGRAHSMGKPAVVATEMLQSMTGSSRPTRAEATDVANAVFEGAAGILLSAETAIGANPVGSTRAATRILEAAERHRWCASERGPDLRESVGAAGHQRAFSAGVELTSPLQRVG